MITEQWNFAGNIVGNIVPKAVAWSKTNAARAVQLAPAGSLVLDTIWHENRGFEND